MTEQYLFVYGTLRYGSGIPQQRLLRKHAELMGDATINACLYDLGGYPGIILSRSHTDLVNGELYRLKHYHCDQLLSQLDEYEECSPNLPQPHEYRRELADVQLCQNKIRVRAWAYIYNREIAQPARIVSGDYYRP